MVNPAPGSAPIARERTLALRVPLEWTLDSLCPVVGPCTKMGHPIWQMSAAQFKGELRRVGMSKRRLAMVFHVSRSTVYRWATGEVEIPGPVAVLMRTLPKGWKP